MTRYFLHLVDGEDILLDPDGVLATEDAIRQIALYSARDCIAGDIRAGFIDLSYRIDIDEAGVVVHSIPFREAVTIRDRSPASA